MPDIPRIVPEQITQKYTVTGGGKFHYTVKSRKFGSGGSPKS
jgi:hypothetical protein